MSGEATGCLATIVRINWLNLKRDRVAAVKVLSPHLTATDDQRSRFVRAMKTMLPIEHENLVRLYHAGKTGPYCWAAMEYVEGENLASVIERIGIEGMLDWRKVWQVAINIAQALQTAAEHKVIQSRLPGRRLSLQLFRFQWPTPRRKTRSI